MSDIFREVDEEFRRSKAEQVWAKYSGFVLLACTILVIGVATYRFFEWQSEKAAAEAGAKFNTALQLFQTGKAKEGEDAIAGIANGNPGIYKSLAQFRAASELGKRDAVAAIKSFDQLASDSTLNAALRDVARLRAATLAVDSLPFADVERRMGPLLSSGNAWRHSAHEMLAAAALKANELDKARQYLDSIIIDREAPQPVKTRAELLIGLTRGAK
jgi:hypothetical protein